MWRVESPNDLFEAAFALAPVTRSLQTFSSAFTSGAPGPREMTNFGDEKWGEFGMIDMIYIYIHIHMGNDWEIWDDSSEI